MKVTVLRDGAERHLEIPTVALDGRGTDRFLLWEGAVLQTPHDPGVTYSGHKGQGYEVLIAETCDPENAVQLLTQVSQATTRLNEISALEKRAQGYPTFY